MASLGIGYGDEVILPTLTFIATVNSVVNIGAKPIFVDASSDWQINPDEIRKKITKKTKAIIAVHLYGYPSNLKELLKIIRENKIALIEDCAEAFGTKYKGKHVGTFGDVSIFSFYANKTVTTGEGGMLITNKYFIYRKAYQLKMHGIMRNDNYKFKSTGFNFKMTNLSAAVGLAQLEKADEILRLKKNIVNKYKKYLYKLPVSFPKETIGLTNSNWMVTILVDNKKLRNGLRKFLELQGIETRPIFYPIHLLPRFKVKKEKYPIAENIASRGINLPSYPSLKDKEIYFICKKIEEFYKIKKLK